MIFQGGGSGHPVPPPPSGSTQCKQVIAKKMLLFILGASLLFFVSGYTAETIIPLYIATGRIIFFGWILETNYWILQNEADGMCIWWFDIKNPWLTVSICTILIQLVEYSVYLAKTYDSLISFKPYKICLPLIIILPFLLCITTILMSISASVYYWYSKVFFAVLGFCQVNYYYSISVLPLKKLRNLTREEINQLIPTKSFMRDLALTFAVIYIILCIVIDMVRLPEIMVFSMSYLSAFVRDWCTSLVIVAAFISSVFGVLSLLVAASRYLVTGLKNMKCTYCLLVTVLLLLFLLLVVLCVYIIIIQWLIHDSLGRECLMEGHRQ